MKLTYTVFKRDGRKFFEVQWVNPANGRKETRSTKETKRRAAENFAKKLIEKIELRCDDSGRTSWKVFVEAHVAEVQPAMPDKTAAIYRTSLQAVQRILNPSELNDIDARAISKFQASLRSAGRSEYTIRTYLAHFRMAMKWAKSQGMIGAVPEFPTAKLSKSEHRAKGRAITGEEFERILKKVPVVIPDETAAATFVRFLRGLWLSGLRLGEGMKLRWDGSGEGIRVDIQRKRPALIITADDEKGRRDRILPVTPDFAAFLSETPEAERRGRVFPLRGIRGEIFDLQYVSAVIVEIGKAANVKVRDKNGRVKFASAHDLRRSFGTRWAPLLNPRDLQILMRHADIKTTQTFYLFEDADELSDRINAAGARLANNSANSGSKAGHSGETNCRK